MPPPKYPPPVFKPGNPGVWGTAGRAPAKKRKPPRRPPRPPLPPLGPGVGGYGNAAEAEADRIIAELLAELGLSRDSARREAERSAQQEMARAQALSSALMALGIPRQIQDIYGRSAGSIGQLAQGFSSAQAQQAAAQGAEQANMVSGTGQEGAVRNEGAAMGDVTYGVGGFIPARGLEQMGAAFASEAALQPGFVQQFGQIAASKVMQDFVNEVLPGFTEKEAQIRTKRPSLVADARGRRRKETFELYEAGLLTQRQLAKRLGLPNWKRYPNSPPDAERPKASASLSKELGYLVDEFGQPIPDAKGRPIRLPRDPGKLDRFGSATAGYWAVTPDGRVVNLLPPQQKQYAPKGYQLKTLKDGSTAVFDPNSGRTQVIAPPPRSSRSRKPLTPSQKAKYRSRAFTFAQDAYGGNPDDPENFPPLTLAEALEELKRQDIPWGLGKSIVVSYYRKRNPFTRISDAVTGATTVPKGRPARGGRKKNVSFAGSDSLVEAGRGLMGYALSQGFTNLGTHNPASRLPGGGVSDHAKFPAEAFDIGGFSGGYSNARARQMFNWLIRQPGVKYAILGDKIWTRGRGLHAYTAGGHDTHIHVSLYPGSEV